MGGTACKIIIIEGNVAYGVVEVLAGQNPDLHTEFLQAAIQASCNGIQFAGISAEIEKEYISNDITSKIIQLHGRIVTELPSIAGGLVALQERVDELTDKLFKATRRLYDAPNFTPPNIDNVRASLGF